MFPLVVMAILALGVVIMFHEAGHYVAAVWTGMKVDRFSVFGIGPAIIKLGTWRGTEFVISAIPFGAYVQIRGMEAAEHDVHADRDDEASDSFNFRDKPLFHRAIVILGGPLANYATAIALYFIAFAAFGMAVPKAIAIAQFEEGSSAQAAGLEVGDEFVEVGGVPIEPNNPAVLVDASAPYRGKTLPVTVRRDGELVEAKLDVPEDGLALGVHSSLKIERERAGLGTTVQAAATRPFQMSALNLSQLYMLITGQISGQMQGPVGIVKDIAGSAKRGLAEFIEMTALISTLLGMFNLLPLPALDGGRLTFLGIEAIRRRRVSPRVEDLVHGYGMLALLALLLVVTVGDVRRLF